MQHACHVIMECQNGGHKPMMTLKRLVAPLQRATLLRGGANRTGNGGGGPLWTAESTCW